MKTQKGGLKILLVILGAIIIIGGLFLYLQNKNGVSFEDFVKSGFNSQTGTTSQDVVVKKPGDTTTTPVTPTTPVPTNTQIDFNALLDTKYTNDSYKFHFSYPKAMKIVENVTKTVSEVVVINFTDDGKISISDAANAWKAPVEAKVETSLIEHVDHAVEKSVYRVDDKVVYVAYKITIIDQKFLLVSKINDSRTEQIISKFIERVVVTFNRN